MGSSSGDESYNQGAMPPQGPPIDQLNPAQPPPAYTNFLPGVAGQPATGLTQAMMNSIGGGGATASPPALLPAAAGAGAAGAGPSREDLAAMIALSGLRDRKAQEYEGKHFDHPGAMTTQRYVDTNWPMPQQPTAPGGPAAPMRGRM